MNFGPELVHFWALSLQRQYTPEFIDKIEGGREWAALRLAQSKNWLFLSWGTQTNGFGVIDARRIKNILELSEGQNSIISFLKKHILRSRLVASRQLGKDRVLSISFSKTLGAGFTSETDMVLELTGNKANLIMVDNENIIREAAKHINPEVNRYRTILPGVPYTPPPPFNGLDVRKIDPDELEKSIPVIQGIGNFLSKLILRSWQVHSKEEWREVLVKTLSMPTLDSFKLMKYGNYFTIFPESMENCEIIDGDILKSTGTVSTDSMIQRTKNSILKDCYEILEIMIKRKQKHLDGLENQLTKSKKAEFYRMAGELLLSNAFRIGNGFESVTLATWEDSEKTVDIPLDPSLTPKGNAQKYFKMYKKANLKEPQSLSKKIAALQSTIEELKDQKDLLGIIDDLHILKEVSQDIKKWPGTRKRKNDPSGKYIPPHLKIETGGYLLLVGMNAKGNRYVTFRLAKADDLWFHAHEVPGSHVIVKKIGVCDPESEMLVLKIAASLAVYYSKAQHSAKIQVDYTEKKNVRHIPGSGIAHVTYSQPRTLIVSPEFWKEHLLDITRVL